MPGTAQHSDAARPRRRTGVRLRVCGGVLVLVLAGIVAVFSAIAYDLRQAREALRAREAETALEWVAAAESLGGRGAELHLLRARAYRHLGRYEDMERSLARAQADSASDDRIRLERWLALAQVGRVAEVEEHLSELLVHSGEDGAEVCAAFVNGYCLNFNFGAANALLDAWIADYPDDAEPHFRRGNVWYSQRRWQQAIPAYRKCLQLAPGHSVARLRLAQSLLAMSQMDEAEAHFRRSLEEDPEQEEGRLGLANCLIADSQLEEAREVLLQLVQDDPEHFEARRLLGQLSLWAEEPREAIRWLQSLAEDWPENISVNLLLGKALQVAGEGERAEPYLEIGRRTEEGVQELEGLLDEVRKRPGDVQLRFQAAPMILRHRSPEEAIAWLRSVLQLEPRHRDANQLLAEYYSRQGERELSEKHRRLFRGE